MRLCLKPLLICSILVANVGYSEEEQQGEQKAEQETKAQANTLSTNIIGSEEAPTVVNVVPWKERTNKMEEDDAAVSVLSQVLEPLDRDVLKREIEYFKVLKESGRQ